MFDTNAVACPLGRYRAWKSLTRRHIGYSEVPSTLLPARNESNAAGDAEQKPGPPLAMTMTFPS